MKKAKGKASAQPKNSQGGATLGFEAKLWLMADKLRNNMDAAELSIAQAESATEATA